MAERITDKYKRAFFAGLAAILPTILTIGVMVFCWNVLNQYVAGYINQGLRAVLEFEFAKEWYWQGVWGLQDWQLREEVVAPEGSWSSSDLMPFSERVEAHVPVWLGFVLALVLVLMVGFVFKGYVGRQLLRLLEGWIHRIPIIKVIYPYAKQVTEFFFEGRRPIQYESAVAIEYPRKGVYSIAFVTNEGFKDIADRSGQEMVSCFIPSSPTPVTGYTVVVPKADIVELKMSVDQAFRFTISAGVLLPPDQLPPLALKTRKLPRPDSGEGAAGETDPEDRGAPESTEASPPADR